MNQSTVYQSVAIVLSLSEITIKIIYGTIYLQIQQDCIYLNRLTVGLKDAQNNVSISSNMYSTWATKACGFIYLFWKGTKYEDCKKSSDFTFFNGC